MPDKKKQRGREERTDMGQQTGKHGQGQQRQQDNQRRQQGGEPRPGEGQKCGQQR